MAALIARGQTYLANGDVASARLVFRRAAKTGDAQAALALGGTFDPIVLRSLGVIGVAADAAQARSWYEKAAELGSREAPHRIDQLAQADAVSRVVSPGEERANQPAGGTVLVARHHP